MIFEMHCHSNHSDGLPSVEKIAMLAGKRYDVIALTDHNTFDGYFALKKILKNFPIIPAIEISTDNGHMLAYGIEELKFEKGGDAFEIADRVHSSGGVCVIAHPYRPFKKYVLNNKIFSSVDAIEVINGNTLPKYNRKAMKVADMLQRPKTAGSDAHRLKDYGSFAPRVRSINIDAILKDIKKGNIILPHKQTNLMSIFSRVAERRSRKYKRRIFSIVKR